MHSGAAPEAVARDGSAAAADAASALYVDVILGLLENMDIMSCVVFRSYILCPAPTYRETPGMSSSAIKKSPEVIAVYIKYNVNTAN